MSSEFTLGYQAAMHDAALIADSHAGMHRANAELFENRGNNKEHAAAVYAAISASAVAAFIQVKAREQCTKPMEQSK